MQIWFYERTLWVRNHTGLALGLLASIITIGTFIFSLAWENISDRESLRETHGVRVLSPLEEGLRISQLPNGVFGFTTPWSLRGPFMRAVSGDLTLKRAMIRRIYNTEIHKTRDGEIFALVYVDEIALLQLQNPERVDTLDITAFLMPREGSTDQLSAIPLSRLNNWIDRISSEYGTIVDITLN